MYWALLSLFILGAVANPVDEKPMRKSKVSEVEDTRGRGSNRDEKLFSVFQIVKFNNEECTGTSGDSGTCYTAAECSALSGGSAQGSCASGFGVCCVTTLDPCQGTTNSVSAILEHDVDNPTNNCVDDNTDTGRSNMYPYGRQALIEYDYLIQKWSSSIVQIRFDFIYVELSEATNGDCTNDTLLFELADAASMKITPTNLCGTLTGSHVYLDFRENSEIDVKIRISEKGTQRWKIYYRQLEESDSLYAPRGCLQYFKTDTTQSGSIMSFNYNAGSGMLLNNQAYTICIEQNRAYCDVALTSANFDLTGTSGSCSDSISFGIKCLCGTTFGNMGSLLWNYTGSYHIDVMTDADNSAMVGGFEISYMLIAC